MTKIMWKTFKTPLVEAFHKPEDKNGKEIYEGDIILYEHYRITNGDGEMTQHSTNIVVEWSEKSVRFVAVGKIDSIPVCYDLIPFSSINSEIIGNRFENLELIK